MARCETCGNEYDQPMEIRIVGQGEPHVFDCFECAIHAIAPTCERCGVRIVGHGVQAGDEIYCGAACAQREGVAAARDRV